MPKAKKGARSGCSGGAAAAGGGAGARGGSFSIIEVDPRRVRFAHSRIKPVFSGCGRTIDQTLTEIRTGKTSPSDIPMITVVLGPTDIVDGQRWFFTLNNRRLFVFKVCREEGLLGASGLLWVRARAMKEHERDRYKLERCSLQAKFLFTQKATSTAGSATTDDQPSAEYDEGVGDPTGLKPTAVT